MILLLGLIGTLVIGIIVFGGGQVFMPLFSSLWTVMGVPKETIDTVFVVVNSTPGVVGTQLAFFSGFLAGQGNWTAYLLMFATYALFFIPSVIMIIISYRMIDKLTMSKYAKNIIMWMKPVIFGISVSLVIQLLLGAALPNLTFNSINNYIKYGEEHYFFNSWRLIAAICYSVLNVAFSFYLYHFRKWNLYLLITTQIGLAMLIFQPWL